MGDAPTRSASGPARIVQAVILSTNSKTHTVDVAMDAIEAAMPDVQTASLYCHPFGGEGVYFLPEPGATCHVTFPSDGSRPFVSSFVMPPSAAEGDSGGREALNPGDVILSTRDDNFVRVRRGGLVEIGASPLAQRCYVPLSNYVRDFFVNHQELSPGGEVLWTVDQSTRGDSRVEYSFRLKEKAEDPFMRMIVEVGEKLDLMPPEGGDVVVPPVLPVIEGKKESYLRISITGALESEHVIAVQASLDGKLHVRSDDWMYLNAGGAFRIRSGKEMELWGQGHHMKWTQYGAKSEFMLSWEATSVGGIVLTAPTLALNGQVTLGGLVPGVGFSTIRGERLMAWLRQFHEDLLPLLLANPTAKAKVLPPDPFFLTDALKVV